MTGWNMPPGCNPSDIPGNRPEDQEAEARWSAIEEAVQSSFEDGQPGEETMERICRKLDDLLVAERRRGYDEGLKDAQVAAYNEGGICRFCHRIDLDPDPDVMQEHEQVCYRNPDRNPK